MNKKEYVFNLSNLIKNRVKYHSPINFDGDILYSKILEKGIDLSLPIFIMDKPLKKGVFSAFKNAMKFEQFNLIVRKKNNLLKLKNSFLIKEDECPGLEKLDVNYKTNSKYFDIECENFLKIGNKIDFFKKDENVEEYKGFYNNICVDLKRFLLNGESFILELTNTSQQDQEIEIEYNKVLKSGYYSFEKIKNGLKITDIISNKNQYLNASFGNCENFSCIDGVDCCKISRVNCSAKISMKPYQKKSIFINFGSNKVFLNSKIEMDYYFSLSRKKYNEIFNVKIKSENPYFENLFNKVLPEKIWHSWLENTCDFESEREYQNYRNIIVLNRKGEYFLQDEMLKITAVQVFNNNKFEQLKKYKQVNKNLMRF